MRRLFSLFVVVLLILPTFAEAATATKAATAIKPTYTRLFYYRKSTEADASLRARASSIDIFAPQIYKLNEDGSLSGTFDPKLRAFLKAHPKIKVMPLITNAGFSSTAHEALLDDQVVQTKAIAALLLEAKNYGFYGWQFDFEQMDASYKDKYSAFIARAAATFATAGLKTSVAVVSKVSDNPSDYKNTLWQDLIGVYDYDALAKSADFISLMSYDDPESSGPVVELPWLNRVLTYATAHVPPQKISMGIALYYWARDDATNKIRGVGGNSTIDSIIKRRKVSYTFDLTNMIPVMHYKVNGEPYSLYYENGRSIKEKIALIKTNHLYGFSAWALGQEVPSVWKQFQK